MNPYPLLAWVFAAARVSLKNDEVTRLEEQLNEVPAEEAVATQENKEDVGAQAGKDYQVADDGQTVLEGEQSETKPICWLCQLPDHRCSGEVISSSSSCLMSTEKVDRSQPDDALQPIIDVDKLKLIHSKLSPKASRTPSHWLK